MMCNRRPGIYTRSPTTTCYIQGPTVKNYPRRPGRHWFRLPRGDARARLSDFNVHGLYIQSPVAGRRSCHFIRDLARLVQAAMPPPPPPRRTRRLAGSAAVACAACRRLKVSGRGHDAISPLSISQMRCIGASTPPCQRCFRAGRPCDFPNQTTDASIRYNRETRSLLSHSRAINTGDAWSPGQGHITDPTPNRAAYGMLPTVYSLSPLEASQSLSHHVNLSGTEPGKPVPWHAALSNQERNEVLDLAFL